ncbi:Mfa1 family fimbria major subunit [Phocaeicola dorei]|uniref:Mfa1 family fimbria major subunit n=1 Tax=Phocaeicola dorei TaxID=357276 RepID=UPI001C37F681|nr:Mfa1 family fimbria major subunit [Phocaeicola dorei]MBV4239306.1 Mfa1 family fimbria major subunit [Phocaeicola dorei]MCB6462050.1 Mfa1 family fimbria major subunit [Phocaeicola dorei]MCB6747417.1 Mfa1 family fimbria major subunit [Phocaeicola dorei]MCB6772796.1 Mfa1 family fimbria major subunit [Phocaeicola dorei]MCB6791727.1 Mfa1 family fimbria major subunit [Phocaeicola dorei]
MKIRSKFFAMVLASLLMAGCQDEIQDSENSGKTDISVLDGYVKVAINMPSTVGTRAAGTYDNGIADEYQVNEAIIVFFAGDKVGTEAEAYFTKAYNLNLNMNVNTAVGQITSTSDAYIMEAPVVTDDKQLYALAIINPNSVVKLEADGESLTVGGAEIDASSRLGDFRVKLSGDNISAAAFTDAVGLTGKSFTMTNAPLSDKGGQSLLGANATTLVPVTVYETREEAAIAPSAQIYVERVVAKVSATVNASIKVSDVAAQDGGVVVKVDGDSQYAGDHVELTGWTLNVANRSTRLVRDVSGFDTWIGYDAVFFPERFVEGSPIKLDGGKKYRINWAVDGNYDSSSESYDAYTDFITYTATDAPSWTVAWSATDADPKANVAYCLENTFAVGDMDRDKTTSLLVKAVYRRAADAEVKDFFVVGSTGASLSAEDFKKYLQANIAELSGADIDILSTAAGGYYNKAGGKMLNQLISATKDGAAVEDLDQYFDNIGVIKYYKDGTTYYYASPIRHFGDVETGWDDGEPYEEAKHLGRYGVVRNTWYQLTVNKISRPGEPEIPDTPNIPDDQQEAYINVQVNILSWAVRQNNVDL